MREVLLKFKDMTIDVKQLREVLGEDLYNVPSIKPEIVSTKDVVMIIEKYISNSISLNQVLDWVNIIWFTDLYTYNPTEEDSIASVITLLETLDEEGVEFTKEDFVEMIDSLKSNKICDL